MNIRKRLLIISTLTFGVVFTLSALLVYSVFYKSSEKIIFNELEYSTLLTAYFYLEEDEMSQKEHNKIRNEFFENIRNSKVKLYNEKNQFVYGDSATGKSQFLTPSVLDKVRKQGKYQFKEGSTYFYGIYYPDNQGNFVVFVISENEFFESQINQLLSIFIISLISGLIIILLLSFYLSKVAYHPIKKITNQIVTTDINLKENFQLEVPQTKDEVQRLAIKFNELFARLAETFSIQKNFINYLSHEIKTPLTAISGTMEVFGKKDRKPEEYENVSKSTIKNVYYIENILNNLLLLSDLENQVQHFEIYRLDEQIWQILERIHLTYPNSKNLIQTEIKVIEYQFLKVFASKGQIEIALYNLIENAVKFSENKPIQILLNQENNHLILTIKDHGKGIPTEEINNVFQAFHRGSNVKDIKGSGIGLSLAILILKQNKIEFEIHSEVNQGTELTLSFTANPENTLE